MTIEYYDQYNELDVEPFRIIYDRSMFKSEEYIESGKDIMEDNGYDRDADWNTRENKGGVDIFFDRRRCVINFYYVPNKKLSDSLTKPSWDNFVSEVLNIKQNAIEFGKSEYFHRTVESFSEMIVKNKGSIELGERIAKFNIKNGSIINSNIIKLPYLYRDRAREGRFILPIFMTHFYGNDTNTYSHKERSTPTNIKQLSGSKEILINSIYFANAPMNIVFSAKTADNKTYMGENKKFKTIEEFCEFIFEDSILPFRYLITDVMLGKYLKSIEGEYYIESMAISRNKTNYYNDMLKLVNLWEKIYNDIVDFQGNDYRILLDKIVLDNQEMIKDHDVFGQGINSVDRLVKSPETKT